MIRPLFPLSLILLLAVVLIACASTSGSDSLAGTQWVLQSLDGNDRIGTAIGDKEVTLNFDQEQRVNGSSGCNNYGGNYEPGEAGAVAFGQMVSTKMACVDGNVMDVEYQFLNALGTADSYMLSGDTLTIIGDGHTLVFVRN